MSITRETVAEKLSAYLRHEIRLSELVDWAECAMMEGEFDPEHFRETRDAVARIGLADVRAFGLTWEDCEDILKKLGYKAYIEISAT